MQLLKHFVFGVNSCLTVIVISGAGGVVAPCRV